MSTSLLAQANDIYKCSRHFTIEYHNIEHSEIYDYSIQLKYFLSSLGEAQLDDYWREKKWKLKKIPFLLSVAPLNKGYLEREISIILQFLENEIDSCEQFYPDHSRNFSTLISSAKLILPTNIEIIKNNVDAIINVLTGSIAILINDTKLIPVVEKQYKNIANLDIEIVSINSLRNNTSYENLLVIGPANIQWYPNFVFSSPRAPNIHVIKFRWMKGTWQPTNVFPGSYYVPTITNEENGSQTIEELINPDLILPSIDFSTIIQNIWEKADQQDDVEYVEAIIGYLENDQIVFLDFDDSSTVRILDIDDESIPVKKIRVKELTPDMFLLLKTSGGGDYIVPLANRILGNEADKLRTSQKGWKDRLRKLENNNGTDWVINELRSLGCSIANPTNLRNWMSYRGIKTSQFSHFQAIMKIVGLDAQALTIWQQMSLLTKAHIQSGRHITNLLLNIAKEANLNELRRLGIMEFELPDKDAGSVTAFRVKDLSDETVLVAPSKIGVTIDLE